MSEPIAERKTKTTVERREQKCSRCESIFGFITKDGFLLCGNLKVQYMRGYCVNCGNTIRWLSTDERMRRMLKGKKKN